MKRRQVVEPVNGFRLYEGTRERCFAPIRERQILRHDVNLSQYQVEGCGPGGHRLRAGIAAAGHGLRAGTLPGRAAHIGRPSACPLRHRCSRFPDKPSSCPASKGRAVVARGSSGRLGLALPSGGGVAAGVCSRLLRGAKLGGRAALGGWVDTGCFPAEIEIQALRAVSAASGLGPPASGGLAPPSGRRRCRRNDPRRTDDRATGRTLLRIRAQ